MRPVLAPAELILDFIHIFYLFIYLSGSPVPMGTVVHVLLLDPQSGNRGARLHLDGSKANFLIRNMGQLTPAAWRIRINKERNEDRKSNRDHELLIALDFLHMLCANNPNNKIHLVQPSFLIQHGGNSRKSPH